MAVNLRIKIKINVENVKMMLYNEFTNRGEINEFKAAGYFKFNGKVRRDYN